MTAALTAMRDAFGEALVALGAELPELVVLDADVSSSTRTALFGQRYPQRFFNVGVAEANMVDMAAGMATCGLRPVVSTFALFLTLKGADQVRNVVCYNKLPVVLAGNYAGLSDSYDGASHQAITDIAVMRAMPNMTVVVPGDAVELRQVLAAAVRWPGPIYVRICRNPTPVLFADAPATAIGEIRKIRDGNDLTMAVCGVPTSMAIEAADRLSQRGISVDLLEVATIKPIDAPALTRSARKTGKVLTIEEHNIYGGLGGAVAEVLARHAPVPMGFIGIQDTYTESGPYMDLLRKYGISVERIESEALRLLKLDRS
jgi:transketolase